LRGSIEHEDERKETSMSRLQLAIDQIVAVRGYTVRLLDHTEQKDWFRFPPGGVTHVAWQVGHLAMAQYRLGLERTRGKRPGDDQLISEECMRLFGRESAPNADASRYPPAAAIRNVFDRVHEQFLRDAPSLSEEDMDAPVLKPHPLAKTKLWSLLWSAQHEMIHAGQIGLLRRLLGYPPLW
jgi:hypothetical protein